VKKDPEKLTVGDELRVPKPKIIDHLTTAAGMGATAVSTLAGFPLAGPLTVEGLKAIIGTGYEHRRERFLETLVAEINDLKRRVGSGFENLETNEGFQTAFAHALPVALRSHEEEKLRALRNAVINAAAVDPEDDRVQIYIRYVDELTPGHVRLLAKMLESEDELYRIKTHHDLMVRLSSGIVPVGSWADDFRVRLQDLVTRGLIRISPSLEELDDVFREDLVTTQVGERKDRPMVRVTRVGRAFLEFISDPIEWRLRIPVRDARVRPEREPHDVDD
jgi:hypothetical protein